MSWLYAAAQPFVGHAERAFRVDLLFSWPGLLLCTIACAAWWLRQAPRQPGLEPQ